MDACYLGQAASLEQKELVMKTIYLIGLTGEGKIGHYEHQLGNAAILIPMLALFKKHIPEAEVFTTIQLTDDFCEKHRITRLPLPKKRLPRFNNVLRIIVTLVYLLRISLWQFLKQILHLDLPILIKGSDLERYANSDIVLDFNGDIFPSDTRPIRVLVHALELLCIAQLGVPVIEFVSSPGPFNSWFTRTIAKLVFSRFSILLNREPISSVLLDQIGLNQVPIVNTACPAFLLEPLEKEQAQELLSRESIDVNIRPLIGVTLCGYNLGSLRTWTRPEHFKDLVIYVSTLRYLLDDLHANVFLLPHVYRTNPYTYSGEWINGPDYDILLNLYKLLDGDKYSGRLKLIEGKYSPSEAKGMIGQCDLFMSGRLHAGVAALSQGVPTIFLAYGHKHRGFASLLHHEKYVYEGKDPDQLLALVKDAWENRQKISYTLHQGMVRVEELVNLNFEIIKEILEMNQTGNFRLPEEKVKIWMMKGAQPPR